MFNEAFVVFFATTELFFNSAFDTARNGFFFRRRVVKDILALNHSHVFVVRNILTINSVVCGLGETEVIDSIQQIGLALTVETNKTIELVREAKGGFSDILVVEYADFL